MLSRFVALPVANLNRVTIADEWHDHTNDSAFTNAGARSALRFAADAAEMVGDDAAPIAAWRQLAGRLTIIYNDTTKVVAEYNHYDGGAKPHGENCSWPNEGTCIVSAGTLSATVETPPWTI